MRRKKGRREEGSRERRVGDRGESRGGCSIINFYVDCKQTDNRE